MSTAGDRRNVANKQFWDLYRALPKVTRDMARGAFRLFLANPMHPSLRNHPLHASRRGKHAAKSRSVSISMQYRAIYVPVGDVNLWYWIETHAAYNLFLGKAES